MNDAIAAAEIKLATFDAFDWTVETMPVKYGGLGLRFHTYVAPSAYFAATVVSNNFINLMISTSISLHEDTKTAHWDSMFFTVANKLFVQSELNVTLIRSKLDAVFCPLGPTASCMNTASL